MESLYRVLPLQVPEAAAVVSTGCQQLLVWTKEGTVGDVLGVLSDNLVGQADAVSLLLWPSAVLQLVNGTLVFLTPTQTTGISAIIQTQVHYLPAGYHGSGRSIGTGQYPWRRGLNHDFFLACETVPNERITVLQVRGKGYNWSYQFMHINDLSSCQYMPLVWRPVKIQDPSSMPLQSLPAFHVHDGSD